MLCGAPGGAKGKSHNGVFHRHKVLLGAGLTRRLGTLEECVNSSLTRSEGFQRARGAFSNSFPRLFSVNLTYSIYLGFSLDEDTELPYCTPGTSK